MNQVEIIAQLSNMKDIDYRNSLAIATIIELLIDKGIVTRKEFTNKSFYLDNISLEELKKSREKFQQSL